MSWDGEEWEKGDEGTNWENVNKNGKGRERGKISMGRKDGMESNDFTPGWEREGQANRALGWDRDVKVECREEPPKRVLGIADKKV